MSLLSLQTHVAHQKKTRAHLRKCDWRHERALSTGNINFEGLFSREHVDAVNLEMPDRMAVQEIKVSEAATKRKLTEMFNIQRISSCKHHWNVVP